MVTAKQSLDAHFLERRRRELRMTRPQLAKRSGVSISTVNRILSGKLESATFGNVRAIADALGASVTVDAIQPYELEEQQARAKANELVRMVQATSAIESQGVDADAIKQMVNRAVHELIAGPKRRLWT